MVHVLRAVAAGAMQFPVGVIYVVRAQSTLETEVVRAMLGLNTVGAYDSMNHTGALELFEGDKLEAITVDPSTGGFVSYILHALLTEFDAIVDIAGAAGMGFQGAQPVAAPQSAPSGGGSGVPVLFGSGSSSSSNISLPTWGASGNWQLWKP
jgi:hypothetical protein